jgi:pimeloyl-ACP methyl ester carboxylesterase
MAVEFIEFEVDGETYEARLNTPEDGDAETCVVVLPGAGHGPFGDVFDVTAYELANAGVASFRFETWTSDEELDEKTLAELRAELDAAVAFVHDRGYDRLALLAKSFGGRVALTDLPDAFERVLGWAPAVQFAAESNVDAVADDPLDDVDVNVAPGDVADVDAPVKLLYGDDDYFYPEHARALADALPNAELRIVEDENHSMNENRPAVIRETLDFLVDA